MEIQPSRLLKGIFNKIYNQINRLYPKKKTFIRAQNSKEEHV